MEITTASSSSAAHGAMASGMKPGSNSAQYLTLRLGTEEYAIDILNVQEIRSYEEPTRMVNAPNFIKGVVNLRGVIVPIVDLRLKLNLSKVRYDLDTVVVVLNIRGRLIGAVVDSVSDVVVLDKQAIKQAPDFDAVIDARFITGIASFESRMLIVMNMDVLMSSAELGMAEDSFG